MSIFNTLSFINRFDDANAWNNAYTRTPPSSTSDGPPSKWSANACKNKQCSGDAPGCFALKCVGPNGDCQARPVTCSNDPSSPDIQCRVKGTCVPTTGKCPAPDTTFAAKGTTCNDGDDTTKDDTCDASGNCVGIPKCEGVTCPKEQCRVQGTCVPTTGKCPPPTFVASGTPCTITTAFDGTCDDVGSCILTTNTTTTTTTTTICQLKCASGSGPCRFASLVEGIVCVAAGPDGQCRGEKEIFCPFDSTTSTLESFQVTTTPQTNDNKIEAWMLAVAGVGGFLVLILAIYCRYRVKHRKRKYVRMNEAFMESNDGRDEDILFAPAPLNTQSIDEIRAPVPGADQFSYKELSKATNNLAASNCLERGPTQRCIGVF